MPLVNTRENLRAARQEPLGLARHARDDVVEIDRARPQRLLAGKRQHALGELSAALGGGYVASGATRADRQPVPVAPAGLRLDAREGAGEAQTPLLGDAARGLAVGDRVYLRHAKAGELCERFNAPNPSMLDCFPSRKHFDK